MATITLDEKKFRSLLKQTLVELFDQRRDLFSDIIIDALEEIGLAHAIRQGRRDEFVNDEEINSILGG